MQMLRVAKIHKKLLIVGTAAMLFVPLAVSAGTYQFIMSGDPVAASTENSRAVASSGTSLMTGRRTVQTASAPLEARCRAWDGSGGVPLRSDKPRGCIISIR